MTRFDPNRKTGSRRQHLARPPIQRRRVRVEVMAQELDISIRQMRRIHTMGLPYTQVEGVIWYEPAKIHAWLDRYNRIGAPQDRPGRPSQAKKK